MNKENYTCVIQNVHRKHHKKEITHTISWNWKPFLIEITKIIIIVRGLRSPSLSQFFFVTCLCLLRYFILLPVVEKSLKLFEIVWNVHM